MEKQNDCKLFPSSQSDGSRGLCQNTVKNASAMASDVDPFAVRGIWSMKNPYYIVQGHILIW